jgi:hypothetical protein
MNELSLELSIEPGMWFAEVARFVGRQKRFR